MKSMRPMRPMGSVVPAHIVDQGQDERALDALAGPCEHGHNQSTCVRCIDALAARSRPAPAPSAPKPDPDAAGRRAGKLARGLLGV